MGGKGVADTYLMERQDCVHDAKEASDFFFGQERFLANRPQEHLFPQARENINVTCEGLAPR